MARFVRLFATLLLLILPAIWCQMTFAERKALEDFKIAVPSLAIYWGANDTGPCGGQWKGITCTLDGRVKVIDITGLAMAGSLPDSLGDISALTSLSVSGNRLKGTIPASIGDLSQLQTLNNTFSGNIPETIGNLTKLRVLMMSFNNLTGTIPSSLGSLINLQILGLGYNNLVGTIPDSLGGLSSLTSFDGAANKLTGTIPSSLINIQTLQAIGLNQNLLNGTLPNDIEDAKIRQLQIYDNQISGTLPSVLGRLPNLSFLTIQNNKFVGCVSLEHRLSGSFIGNKFCCYDTRYDEVTPVTYPCDALTTLSIGSGSVKSPINTYYTSLSVASGGLLDLKNQKDLITVECLTINGTICVNMSSIDTSTQLTDVDLIKFTCSSTNISSIVMDIITSSGCQSSYQIREKIVGRNRTVNVDISIECQNAPKAISNPPIASNTPVGAPFNPPIASPMTLNQPVNPPIGSALPVALNQPVNPPIYSSSPTESNPPSITGPQSSPSNTPVNPSSPESSVTSTAVSLLPSILIALSTFVLLHQGFNW